jgi:hypothetical protein
MTSKAAMKKMIAVGVVLVPAVLLAFWMLSPSRAVVRDVRKPETIVLKKGTRQGNIVSIRIHCHGEIIGNATICLMSGDHAYRTEKVSGAVNFTWGGEWYTDSAEIRYEPRDVRSGQLYITYDFSDW